MAVQVKYPGVYIDEFQPAAPIEGVSTSVAAFLGANGFGPPNKPTLITSWDEYRKKFALPAPTPPEDDDYLWYGVRGFFENGGQTCYVTAVTNAKFQSFDLFDGNPGGAAKTLKVLARRSGVLNPALEVKSIVANVTQTASIYDDRPALTANAAVDDTIVKVANPARFLAGDELEIFDTATPKQEAVTVAYTDAAGVHLTKKLANGYLTAGGAALRFAPLKPGQKSVRITGPDSAIGPRSLVVGAVVTLSQQGVPDRSTIVTAVRAEPVESNFTTYNVELKDAISGFARDAAKPISLKSEEFTLTVQEQGGAPIVYENLSMSAMHPNYYEKRVNGDENGLIRLEAIATNATGFPNNRPIQQPAFAQLLGGETHLPSAVTSQMFSDALDALAPFKDVSIVAAPGITDSTVQKAMRAHCYNLWDRVAIFDPEGGADLTRIQTQESSLQDDKGFGALYFPRIEVASAKTGLRILIPPSGHVAGIYARTDTKRGVFKAPAGNEAMIAGALAVERVLTDSEQGILNPKGINVIRVFSNGGSPIVWGARTTSTDTNWQYVNIRRLFLFLEESIQTGIRGAVFEPNNQSLWQKLKRTIGAFLNQQWRDGALFGAKPEDAFYVRIDEALNPDSERSLGRLHIEIGIRPSYPAEFIIVRIGIWQGGGDVGEA